MALGCWLAEEALNVENTSQQPFAKTIMNAPPPADRYFTVEEANRMLPLVRAIVSDIVALSNDLTERNDRLSILQVADVEEGDPYSEEVQQMQRELEVDMDRLQDYVDELSELGVELKSATQGLVDFRTEMNGRDVYLCWRLDEAEIGHWHELNAGYEGRQSLFEGAAASDTFPTYDGADS